MRDAPRVSLLRNFIHGNTWGGADRRGTRDLVIVNNIIVGYTPNDHSNQYSHRCNGRVFDKNNLQRRSGSSRLTGNNIDSDPLFQRTSATGADFYRLQGTSPCKNNGAATGAPAEDYNGDAHDSQPDIGADELP